MVGNAALRGIQGLSTEHRCYAFVLTTCAIISSWTLYHESKDVGDHNRIRRLGLGWHILGIRRDNANFEWIFWFSDLRESIVLCICGHVCTSWVFAKYLTWAKDGAIALFCVYCVHAALGNVFIVVILLTCVFFVSITYFFKSVKICWVTTISSILLLHFDGLYMEILPFALQLDGNLLVIAYSALGFTLLRCSSFCLEQLYDEEPKKEYGIAELLLYNFYLPYFFFGPVMTYDTFLSKDTTASNGPNIIRLAKVCMKLATAIMVVDFMLHFVHISSIADDLEWLRNAPGYAVGFVLFCNVFLDWMKASILYDLTRGIAHLVDNRVAAPNGPPCIATICTFADTYFDRGVQHWVSRYCYDRFGDDHNDLAKEARASLATFMVVAIWQGLGLQVIVWAILNCLGLTFEFFISELLPDREKDYKRAISFFLGLNYWCIVLSNVVGINGAETAVVAFKSMFLRGNIFSFGIPVFISYCYIELIRNNREVEKKEN